MVQAVTHFKDPEIVANVRENLGAPMVSYVLTNSFLLDASNNEINSGCNTK